MFRTITVPQDTNFEALSATVLDGRIGGDRAAAALTRIADLNPHIADPANLKAGTVLILPDTPGLKRTAGDAVAKAPWNDFKALVGAALDKAARAAQAGQEARAAQRADLAEAMKRADVKRVLKTDKDLDAQAQATATALEGQEQAGRDAVEKLTAMSEAVRAALARLDTLAR
jgi:hypothetical protein